MCYATNKTFTLSDDQIKSKLAKVSFSKEADITILSTEIIYWTVNPTLQVNTTIDGYKFTDYIDLKTGEVL